MVSKNKNKKVLSEEEPLIVIFQKGNQTIAEYAENLSKYQAFGILKSLSNSIEEELKAEWISER